MKRENWIVFLGLIVLLVICVKAIFDSKERVNNAASNLEQGSNAATLAVVPQNMGAEVNLTFNPELNQNQNLGLPAALPQIPNQPATGVANFEESPAVKFSGVVKDIIELPMSDNRIHVTIHTSNGDEQNISLAPDWFLTYIGCTVAENDQISGIGFSFDNMKNKDPLIYARKFKLDGLTCLIRNDEGFALWSNRLR